MTDNINAPLEGALCVSDSETAIQFNRYLQGQVEAHGMEYQVRFSKWNPYSPDIMFKIPYDCVMTISNPEPGLQKAYESKLTQKKEIELNG